MEKRECPQCLEFDKIVDMEVQEMEDRYGVSFIFHVCPECNYEVEETFEMVEE